MAASWPELSDPDRMIGEGLRTEPSTTTSFMVNDFYGCLLQANEHLVVDSDYDGPVAAWLDAN